MAPEVCCAADYDGLPATRCRPPPAAFGTESQYSGRRARRYGGSRSVKPSVWTLREGENHWGPVNERLCFSETRFLHFHSDPLRCSRLLVRASHSYLGILVSAMIGDSWIGVSMLRAATLGEYVCVGPSWLGPDTNVLCVNGLG